MGKKKPVDATPEELLDIRYFQPSREGRRRVSGKPCQMCGLPLHHSSIMAVQILRETKVDRTVFIHQACLRLLTDQVASVQGPGDGK